MPKLLVGFWNFIVSAKNHGLCAWEAHNCHFYSHPKEKRYIKSVVKQGQARPRRLKEAKPKHSNPSQERLYEAKLGLMSSLLWVSYEIYASYEAFFRLPSNFSLPIEAYNSE